MQYDLQSNVSSLMQSTVTEDIEYYEANDSPRRYMIQRSLNYDIHQDLQIQEEIKKQNFEQKQNYEDEMSMPEDFLEEQASLESLPPGKPYNPRFRMTYNLRVKQQITKRFRCFSVKSIKTRARSLLPNFQMNFKQEEKDKKRPSYFLLPCHRLTHVVVSCQRKKELLVAAQNQKQAMVYYRREKDPVFLHKRTGVYLIASQRKTFDLMCQRKNKQKTVPKQAEEYKKTINQLIQYVEPKKEKDQEKELIARSATKFSQFFSKCKQQSSVFTCPAGNPAQYVCISKQCQANAFICEKGKCVCIKNHLSCSLKLGIQMFVQEVLKNIERQREISLQLFLFEEMVMQKIAENRRKMTKLLPFQGIGCQEFLDCLSSKEEPKLSMKSCDVLNYIDQFHKQKKYDLQKLQQMRNKLAGEKQAVKDILQSTIGRALKKFNKQEMIRMPSKLVLNKPDIKFILQQLDHPRDLKLIYRASQHEFSLQKYHKMCDNVEHTLTIIKTQHQKLIGGYTPIKLNTKNGRDRTNKTFLMNIEHKQRLQHIHRGQCAIYCDQQLGPCFGGFYERRDIEVFQYNGILYCKTNFPCAYNWEVRFLPSQDSWFMLTGVSSGQVCRVIDFEVFRVELRE